MEVATTPDFIYPPYIELMHSNHMHHVAITLTPNVWVRGALILEGPGEEILQHSPSESSHDDSSTIIIPHLEELLESHITSRSL